MSKLKIPVNPLLGSPLTAEELKSILGGQVNFTRICHCTYHYRGSCHGDKSCPTSENVAADSESLCSEKCQSNCNSNGQCVSADFEYSVKS